ncbi:hypothetical protein APR41_05845 [Salegentibacter salinarum]|uniref:Glycoside hydrolase family 65 n=1 Tax=Salegentibacter salinarum TaxID=447422 RepID=A0A2N0TST5_9FLAO|nr:hypothetical protein APR41_05845 [Salegentibacter salinarum]
MFYTACNFSNSENKEHTDEPESKIDRKALVSRHNVKVDGIDTLASLSVGNGAFAFTVDATGLQTFPDSYQFGVPLGTQSEWGWDSHPNPENYRFDETLVEYDQNGRKVTYSVQRKELPRSEEAVNYYRENPHRIQLANLGLELLKENGEEVKPEDLQNIQQELNLWTGEIESAFEIEGVQVKVYTAVHQSDDVVGIRIKSELIEQDRLQVRIRIPFPTAEWEDLATKWEGDEDYSSTLSVDGNRAHIKRVMDSITYNIGLQWQGNAAIEEKEEHYFVLKPSKDQTEFEFTTKFSNGEISEIPDLASVTKSSQNRWEEFWQSGGAVDFSGSTDERAHELERRVILSQYLTKLQCTGSQPPQETGLTYNSWFGKPHLEMHWWHGVHLPLWGRPELLEKSMPWYDTAFDKAKGIAERQGFEGARWQKMTDHSGYETPSSVAALLIWQQPHFITFSELLYRADSSEATLNKYKERVFATADLMASFPNYNKDKDRYELGPPVIPAQERFPARETFNPTYELAYWEWGLKTAIEWKERLNEEVPEKWVEVLEKLSEFPVQDDVYLATESATDSYTNPEYKTDHPSVFGTYGMLPETSRLDKKIMKNTFDLIWETWSWEETWGWDFPMTAMTAARLGKPNKAVDALFMNPQTNTYLKNGHNYQEERLTLYLPGNGGVLTAVAMMCAGWDGSEGETPGFPEEGWEIKWEGLEKMP